MPDHKSHHYVPQMYMRLFARPGEKRVGVYVIDARKFVPEAPIKGQLARDYFYGKDPRAEKAFGRIEDQAALIFARAVSELCLPAPGSVEHEWLTFYLGIQHSRTVGAAAQHNENSEKFAKAILRRQAELDKNEEMLKALDSVRIRRTNAVSEVVGYATIGASLLGDLAFVLVANESESLFISSDTPVVLHNRLNEHQPIRVTGFGNVGLQAFLPLGPRLLLLGYDPAAYARRTGDDGVVHIRDAASADLINDLQWESAHAVLLTSPDIPPAGLDALAERWVEPRKRERTIYREQIVSESETELRTRHGSGQVPSAIALDLPFLEVLLPRPALLAPYEVPPLRDADRAVRVERAFERLEMFEEMRRAAARA